MKNHFTLVFSTVLFVDGNPVGYSVYEEKNQLILNPSENPNREVTPPVLSARMCSGKWFIEGTHDRNLIDQVIEDITTAPRFPR